MKKISASLSYQSIKGLMKKLEDYSKSLNEKNSVFVNALLEHGIRVAVERNSEGTHHMPERVTFEKEINTSNGKVIIGAVVGIGTPFRSDWIDAENNEQSGMVFPLSMMEFGSAGLALPEQDAFGGHGGQGSFAISGNENSVSWYVTKVYPGGRKVRKPATAIAPTRPLYNAMIEMRSQIVDCAKQAFGGGE